MFSQFFGSYLLNEGLVTAQQLSKALEEKKNTRLKLGVLAINEKYMTAEQVEQVHNAQATMDKRFGDLAVEMGFITSKQLDELLSVQPSDYLLLGQTLVNDGVLTNSEFEKAINEYKTSHSLSDDDISDDQSAKLSNLISEFYHFETAENAKTYTAYLNLLFKNIIRFIGDDFTPLEASIIRDLDANYMVYQTVSGNLSCVTGVEAEKYQYVKFAGRFAHEELTEVDEYTHAAVGEFLNLHNGLFTVNLSNDFGVELNLDPQDYRDNEHVSYKKTAFCIPISFSFGIVNFIISI